jgi:hypothetical protein
VISLAARAGLYATKSARSMGGAGLQAWAAASGRDPVGKIAGTADVWRGLEM